MGTSDCALTKVDQHHRVSKLLTVHSCSRITTTDDVASTLQVQPVRPPAEHKHPRSPLAEVKLRPFLGMEGRGEVPEECVYGCVHPWWGGNGACSDTEIYGASIRGDSEVCQCDPGYATRDALGNPSCVPRKVHFIAFLMLALVGLGLMAFLLSVAKADMKLSHGDRSIRRARLRKRVTLPARCVCSPACSTLIANIIQE